MQKRGGKFVVHIAFSEIFLVVVAVCAFSFLISQVSIVQAVVDPSTLSNSLLPSATDSNRGLLIGEQGSPPPGITPKPNPTGEGLGIGDTISGIFGGTVGGSFGPLIAGLAWGATIALGIKLLGSFIGLKKDTSNALAISALLGSVAGGGIAALVNAKIIGTAAQGGNTLFGLSSTTAGAVFGIGIAVVAFLLLYKKESKKVVNFQCLPWEAPLGGAKCEVCNSDPNKPCSEYRCKSLGQACDLVNKGTADEKCTWINPKDVTSPTITPLKNVLTAGYSYVPDSKRPPSLGTKIVRGSGDCVQAFTPLTFGVSTNEPAQCKIDYVHTSNLTDMEFFFGESNLFSYNHTQTLRLPSPGAINAESPELQNDGNYNLYVRCQDANGNQNVDEFVFNFCVDPSPDTTPPVIVDTSISTGSPVLFGVQSVPISVYVNEPAECKWSVQDKAYDDMENSFSCSTKVYQQNAQQLYPCLGNLTGIKDRQANTFYFRCRDKPSSPDSERNTNVQSYVFKLFGSQNLNIISSGPNGTITGSTDTVKVDLTAETSNGAEQGKAVCYFSPSGNEGSFISFFDTSNFEHKQTLTLSTGNYTYFLRCIDAGGNADNSTVRFNVLTDRQAPKITRAYKELDALKLVTNENALCSYSLNNCNFNIDEGTKFIYSNPTVRTNHFAQWQSNSVLYIKCKDDFGNQPSPNECSLVARGTLLNN